MPKDTLNSTQMAASYGFALAFLNSDKELKALFSQAVKKGWEPQMFVARLRATKWFKRNSASVRNAIMQQTADPATYKDGVLKMYAQVRDAWGKTYGGQGISGGTLKAWAETAYRMGWTQEMLMDRMGASINFQQALAKDTLGGTARETERSLDEMAAQMGVSVGGAWKAANLRRILMGDESLGAAQDRIRSMAMAQYKAFADQIEAGRTVQELADPYRQKMAELLEINPGDVNIRDSYIQRAMTAKDAKTGQHVPQDLSDFADTIRRDQRWQYTDNAKKEVANVAGSLLRSFGLVN